MAADDISQLADALSKTHVGDGELSYQGRGLKLDNAESGGTWSHSQHFIVFIDLVLMNDSNFCYVKHYFGCVVCLVFSGGVGI